LFLEIIYYGFAFHFNGFIIMNCDFSNYNQACSLVTFHENIDINMNVWHARLGHIRQERMNRLTREGYLDLLTRIDLPTSEHCLVGKITRNLFGKGKRSNFSSELIHFDICGPMSEDEAGASYFITVIDDFTHYGYVYLISHKSKASECFTQYTTLVDN